MTQPIKQKTLKTSYGKDVTISRGHYGWKISQAAETAAVLSIIKNGEQQTREPEYSQKAASRGANDYGSTYVEINLTAQHLYFYKTESSWWKQTLYPAMNPEAGPHRAARIR